MAESLQATLAEPYHLKVPDVNSDAQTLQVESSASAGVCVLSGNSASDTRIIKLADEAMYSVKKGRSKWGLLYQ
jgi:GGDEF domain-containing protein